MRTPSPKFVAIVLAVACYVAPIYAKTSHVKGYTTKKGTYVSPHERKSKGGGDTSKPKATKPPKTTKAAGATRDARGRIQRSDAARHALARQTGYPNGRPGYVIDHIVPLACGGADAPSNMQWQTIADAKAKDRIERRGCR